MRVNLAELPKDNWHHFLRLRDLRQAISEIPLPQHTRVLELGAGDGAQTEELRNLFFEVVPVDIAPSADVEGLIVADAADLPFEDGYFGLVFSSNVLEHVERLDDSFAEMKRVLAPGGIMIHSMPTGTWKLIQVIGRPVATLVKLLRLIIPGVARSANRAHPSDHDSNHRSTLVNRSLLKIIIGQFIPTIHGVSGNHFKEFIRFRPYWWRRKFLRVGLDCFHTSPLYLHSPYDMLPFRFLWIRDRLSRFGITSVQIYWLRIK